MWRHSKVWTSKDIAGRLAAIRSWKRSYHPQLLGKENSCQHLDFNSMIPILDFWLPEPQEIKSHLSEGIGSWHLFISPYRKFMRA